ncbi:hypothetical protein [Cohaesibacter celericrescens]|uniref:Uncharacterized protein n=1 Tax=Cohaesibacter celericrescens TaxID=2067669 RepID=A0A2N5XL19_9HYPH|nr:hypothetical protein [Cohaesibacter celericrescens]PLW75203.1 hypothetical protein C0081_20505 [Cohaesibacter celericrescens]
MVQQSIDQQPAGDDPFQSPEMLEMQRKMRKMVFWSLMIMVLGISSIVGVLIYKSVNKKESPAVAELEIVPITHMLNSGETVRSMIVENGEVFLLVDGKGMTSVLKIDKKTGSVSRRIEFIPQAD